MLKPFQMKYTYLKPGQHLTETCKIYLVFITLLGYIQKTDVKLWNTAFCGLIDNKILIYYLITYSTEVEDKIIIN